MSLLSALEGHINQLPQWWWEILLIASLCWTGLVTQARSRLTHLANVDVAARLRLHDSYSHLLYIFIQGSVRSISPQSFTIWVTSEFLYLLPCSYTRPLTSMSCIALIASLFLGQTEYPDFCPVERSCRRTWFGTDRWQQFQADICKKDLYNILLDYWGDYVTRITSCNKCTLVRPAYRWVDARILWGPRESRMSIK